jgi:hypothetical protein
MSVDDGQALAARALGMTPTQVMRKVVIPQLTRIAIPPTANEYIGMIKYTSLASVISLQELLEQSPAHQQLIVDELVRMGSPHAVRVVMSFITALPEGDFKEGVVRRTLSIYNRESFPAILELITSTTDASVLRVSRAAFSKLIDSESLQKVLDTYDATSDSKLRERLASSVSMVANEDATPLLMHVVADSGVSAMDGMVKASVEALRQIGTAPAVDAIVERLNSETSDEPRAMLSAELAQVVNPAAEAGLQSAAMGQTKFATTPEARVAAIQALTNFPSAETQESLRQLQSATEPQVSFAATEALRAIETRMAAQ